jgi:hypothetical protein
VRKSFVPQPAKATPGEGSLLALSQTCLATQPAMVMPALMIGKRAQPLTASAQDEVEHRRRHLGHSRLPIPPTLSALGRPKTVGDDGYAPSSKAFPLRVLAATATLADQTAAVVLIRAATAPPSGFASEARARQARRQRRITPLTTRYRSDTQCTSRAPSPGSGRAEY